MLMIAKMAILGFALLALGACTSTTSDSNFDPSVSFEGYQTFSLLDEPLIFFSDKDLNPEVLRVVSHSIENEMTTKGFRKAESTDAADFTIGFALGATRYIETRRLPVAYQSALGSPWSMAYYYEDREFEIRQGSLAIHVFDVAEKKAVFSTTGTKRLGNKDTAKGIAEIPGAVKELLAEFPPN